MDKEELINISRLQEYNSHLAITVLLEIIWQDGEISAEQFMTVMEYYNIEPLDYLN